MDTMSCSICGGLFECGHLERENDILCIRRCPYCGNEECYLVRNARFSFSVP
ncbi:MAG TPA: hypothetical protein PK718_00190 [Candidatus Methanofastidiosa archaeon]|nr:hypothetical protein [Candidatus Methanofastidiosa archaeon]